MINRILLLLLPMIAVGGVVRDQGSLGLPEILPTKDKVYGDAYLPYDAEVEWIQGGVIDSGLKPRGLKHTEMEAKVLRPNSMPIYNNNFIGCHVGDSNSNTFSFRSSFVKGLFVGIQAWIHGAQSIIVNNQSYVLCSLKNGVLYVNGAWNKNFGSTSEYSCLYNIAVCGFNNWSGLVISPYKTVYAKIWDDKVLVRDYIPVRKGTVGYMYERVSGTLVAPTSGRFTYGKDIRVVKPKVAMTSKIEWTAKDYVGNKFIHLDAIENVGYGKPHQSSILQWRDLASGYLLTRKYGTWAWTDKSLASSMSDTFSANNVDLRKLGSRYTVEMTSTSPYGGNPQNARRFRCSGNISGQFINGSGYGFLYLFGTACATGSDKLSAWGCPWSLSELRAANHWAAVVDNGVVTWYMNGGKDGKSYRSTFAPTLFVGTFDVCPAYGLYGISINAIRICDEALSLQELRHNYEVDKIRFNLP